jgi:Conserved hypothetical ATP binding protein
MGLVADLMSCRHRLQLLGRRVAVVNLDPANDALPYEFAVDVRDLISLEEVQEQEGLGPNGGASPRCRAVCCAHWAPTSFANLTYGQCPCPFGCQEGVSCTWTVSESSLLSHRHMTVPNAVVAVNAGLVFCMDYVEANMDWLKEQLQPLVAGD